MGSLPPPMYTSWADFKVKTDVADVRAWCATKVKVANRPRLMSGNPAARTSTDLVFEVLIRARGRCWACGSLALERRPSNGKGHPLPWDHIGRRIGSLGHLTAVAAGGTNNPANLAWECLWCNTWPRERKPGARNHGGIQVQEPDEPDCHCRPFEAGSLRGMFVDAWCVEDHGYWLGV